MSRADEIWEIVEEQLRGDGEYDDLADFISDGENDEDEQEFDQRDPPIQQDRSFPTTIFIAGLPKVPQEKYAKLMSVVDKTTKKHGNAETVMPMNEETGTTYGVVIVTYDTVAEADKAM